MNQNYTIEAIVRKHKSNEIDITEWNEQFIQKSIQLNPKIKAWEYFDEQLWRNNLQYSLTNSNPNYSQLLGVPIGIKDIFNTIDMPTCMGSPLWKGFTPGNDARVVHNIKFHGGITAGKTVTAEFAVHTPNETKNPWDINFSPGTSSSGSAAAVASGMVPLAIGTQTAGSIIRPASYCGIYGFRPSYGSLPRTGMLKTTDTLDSIGLFARNIEDCQLLFDVMRVKGLDYPYIHKKLENEDYQKINSIKWKIGIVTDQHNVYSNYQNFAKKAFTSYIKELEIVDTFEIGYPTFEPIFNDAHDAQRKIYHKSLSYYFKKEFENNQFISPVFNEIMNDGMNITPAEYHSSIELQTNLAHSIEKIFEDYDVLITLSTAGTAPLFGNAIDPADTCLIWSMCGLPIVNIPQFNHDGMPFGLQVICKKYGDYKLIQFAKELIRKGLAPEFSDLSN